MNSISYSTYTSTFRSIRLPSYGYDRINFRRLEDEHLEDPDEYDDENDEEEETDE